MDRINDGRRDIIIHGNASKDELPMTGLPELPAIGSVESFIPANMDEPKIYPGDVIVGVKDDKIHFAELIYQKLDGEVLVIELNTGQYRVIDDQVFSSRFYKADEIHLYDDVTDDQPEWDVEFDESKLKRPEVSRAR